jgi:hypothetical protein
MYMMLLSARVAEALGVTPELLLLLITSLAIGVPD